jgi:protein SCO1/2
MTDPQGEMIRLSDLRGKPVLLFFGYTHCPDECPNTLLNYTRVKEALGAQADAVQFLFISVDAQRDSPEVMADYLANFDSEFIGMTNADSPTLQQLGREFGLVMEKVILGEDGSVEPAGEDAEDYFVSHSSPIFLIDASGKLNRLFFYGTTPAVIADNLRDFLA